MLQYSCTLPLRCSVEALFWCSYRGCQSPWNSGTTIGALRLCWHAHGPCNLMLHPEPHHQPAAAAARFIHVSSAGVTRPNRPGINVDQEPPAVKLNDALGGLLTYKLAGEDVVSSTHT